jgi:3-oxoacyl-[acyl-carrier protein] reductase
MELSKANIIITGAGSGFGKAMALYFSSRKATVFAIDINKTSLSKLKKKDKSIYTYICDVSNNDDVEIVIDKIFKHHTGVNVLINNAGIMKNAPLVNILNRPDSKHSIKLWNEVIQVNQNSVFYMARSVIDSMIKNRNKGVVINISSIAAKGNAGQTAYSASKAAVEAMSRVWAKELGTFGIRSVAIAPGFMNTLGTNDALEKTMLGKWVSKTPLNRTGTIDEVVLASQFAIENDFFNGVVLDLNGGLVL